MLNRVCHLFCTMVHIFKHVSLTLLPFVLAVPPMVSESFKRNSSIRMSDLRHRNSTRNKKSDSDMIPKPVSVRPSDLSDTNDSSEFSKQNFDTTLSGEWRSRANRRGHVRYFVFSICAHMCSRLHCTA